MISFFSLLNRRTGTVENFMIPAGIDPFLAGWTVLVLVIAGCVWMLLPQRHASLVTTVLIPLASLGLLLPPFLRYGLQETLPAVVAFIVICEAIICSVGPSNAKKYFHIGSFTFVFWTRSFGLIGMIVGYAAAILLFDIMKIAIDFDILLIMFAAYAILCLTVAVMLGRIGLKAPAERERESTPAAAAHALAERYGLTAREAEVLELVAQGRNMTYVQKALCISPGTSSTHINHIHQKLDVHS
ncbi:MAG: response regulator transcription factor, partial [Eggerthella lenta]